MSAEYDIPDEQIKKFKTQLLIKLANCDDPVRLLQAAAALDEQAEKKILDHIESNQGGN